MSAAITYNYPVSGTVAPTVAQMLGLTRVSFQIVYADGDTTAAVVHSLNLSTAEIAAGQPDVAVNYSVQGTGPVALAVVRTDSVSIAVNKISAAGAGGTVIGTISRPSTLVR